jgi:hypothetical protein
MPINAMDITASTFSRAETKIKRLLRVHPERDSGMLLATYRVEITVGLVEKRKLMNDF